jgi:hypothetical protein
MRRPENVTRVLGRYLAAEPLDGCGLGDDGVEPPRPS